MGEALCVKTVQLSHSIFIQPRHIYILKLVGDINSTFSKHQQGAQICTNELGHDITSNFHQTSTENTHGQMNSLFQYDPQNIFLLKLENQNIDIHLECIFLQDCFSRPLMVSISSIVEEMPSMLTAYTITNRNAFENSSCDIDVQYL